MSGDTTSSRAHAEHLAPNRCVFWRYRFQPVWGFWGHVGIDYTLDDPGLMPRDFLLRHLDYGLPGDRTRPGYQHSIARYCAMVSPGGDGWPPLRTPRGYVFRATPFVRAPHAVGEYLLRRAPRFWGPPGAYRRCGPNSNTGLRRTLLLCELATGYRFSPLPTLWRLGAVGWGWRGRLTIEAGPYPGYFESDRFRFLSPFDADEQPAQPGRVSP